MANVSISIPTTFSQRSAQRVCLSTIPLHKLGRRSSRRHGLLCLFPRTPRLPGVRHWQCDRPMPRYHDGQTLTIEAVGLFNDPTQVTAGSYFRVVVIEGHHHCNLLLRLTLLQALGLGPHPTAKLVCIKLDEVPTPKVRNTPGT